MLHHIPLRQKIITMLAVMSGLFLVALDQTIISTALARIVEDFNSFSSLSWIVTAYLLTSTVTVPIAGKLSDIFGRRLMLVTGVAIFTLASLFSGNAGSIEQLIVARAVQGIGGGIIMANAFTIVGDLFSPRERGRWQGFIGATFGLSSVLGPLLGGFLTDPHAILGLTTSWRWTFWINVPIGIISLFIIAKYCPPIRHDHKPKIDYLGAGFLAVALSSLILAVDNTEKIFTDLISAGVAVEVIQGSLYALAAAAAAAFIWAERRAVEPIIPLSFFRNRTFSTIMVAAFLFGAAFLGAIMYLTQFNIQVFEASATKAGLMLLPMIAGLMVTSLVTGQLVSRTGKYKRLIVGGFTLATVSVFFLSTLSPESPYWHEAIIMTFVGIGMGSGMPIINLAVQNEFAQRDLGAATASSQLFRGLGSTIGTAILGTMLTTGVAAGLSDIAQDPYIQTLRQQPSTGINEDISTDTALNLNTHDAKQRVNEGLKGSLQDSDVPPSVQSDMIANLQSQQRAYSDRVVAAFSDSLRPLFYTSASLMAVATVVAMGIRERPLRDGNDETPGLADHI